MGKLSDFFSMSKQERTGAWLILALIVILIAAVFIERKCSSDNVDSKTQKEINEYVDKAKKIKVKEKKKDKKDNKTTKKSSSTSTKNKGKSQSKNKSEKKSSSSKDKASSKNKTKKSTD